MESRNVLDRSLFELQIIRQCAFISCLKIVFLEILDDLVLSALISGRNTPNNSRQLRIHHICDEKELMMLLEFIVLM